MGDESMLTTAEKEIYITTHEYIIGTGESVI